ncbi:MAG: cysteine desulfurase family protein [Bacteroidota bacterium]|nr:cysteine desulfurase [Candidatus Kapabacteria bacterium]MDW8221066.1 cysteine desulfurase family protein [Bacteroidota bacterium]
MIYLDNSATTRIDEHVLDAMLPWLRDNFGNASSIYGLGRKARVAIENAREEIAALIGAHPSELIFTSGGTESNNTVLKSAVHASGFAQEIVVGATEHHAVLHTAEYLERSGVTVHYIPVDVWGVARVSVVEQHNKPNVLISLMHANNETGVIQPLHAVRQSAPNAYLHTDAVQSFGKIPFNVAALGVDFATLSAHKIHGPKGIGALYIRRGIEFKAHQHGGSQERNRRAGTEPVALIVGFHAAARAAVQELERRAASMLARITLLRQLLCAMIPDIRINTPKEHALPNILNVSFLDADRLDGEAILQAMDMHGIAVSNGSACVSGSLQPSHVLLAMGRTPNEAKAAVRFSVSKDTTEHDIQHAVETLHSIVTAMRSKAQ